MTPPPPAEQTTPATLAERITRLTGAEPDERANLLVVHAPLDSAEDRDAWLKLRAEPPLFAPEIHIYYEGSDAELKAGDTPPPGQRFQITMKKAAAKGELRLYFADSIAGMEAALASADRVRVAEMAADEKFETHHARFEPWTAAAGPPFSPSETLPDPRDFVKDLTGAAAIVPADMRPWLLRSPPEKPGASHAAWLRLAARRVLAALANKVTVDAGTVGYGFTGPPSHTIKLGKGEEEPAADCLQKAGLWVFAEGQDAETRHLLLASEWARAYDPSEQLRDTCAQVLESARVAYDAYVKKESRETLEALAEVREAVIDETQKTSQRAQDLAGALWKDFAVAAIPFVLKILGDAGKIADKDTATVLAFFAAAYLVFSFTIQVYINHSFFKHQAASRVAWQAVLTKAEVHEISVAPIEKSLGTYRRVRFLVGAFYGLLIVALLSFGIATWNRARGAATDLQPAGRYRPREVATTGHGAARAAGRHIEGPGLAGSSASAFPIAPTRVRRDARKGRASQPGPSRWFGWRFSDGLVRRRLPSPHRAPLRRSTTATVRRRMARSCSGDMRLMYSKS